MIRRNFAPLRYYTASVMVTVACMMLTVVADAADDMRRDASLATEMQEFVDRFAAGYESGDVEQMALLYLPDAMIWAHNRPTAIGVGGIREFFALSFSRYTAKVEAHVLHFERRGDRAVLYTLARVDLTPKADGQQPLTAWFRDLVILVQGPSGWLIETNVDQPTTQALYDADLARRPFR